MKRLFFGALCALAFLTACEEEGMKTINVTATIDESKLVEIKPESYEVTFTNTTGGATVTASTENGIASVALVPGIYNVVAKAEVSDGGFAYIVSGAAKDVQFLAAAENATITVDIVKESQLIFKEIYYAGCTYKTGEVKEDGTESTDTYFRDQFYEIYNNSNEVAYVDGLCICQTEYADYNLVFYQFNIENPENYVFAQTIWQLPGTGTDYPVQPGESIIIAQWGANHQAPEYSKGGSPVNLSVADFEAIEKGETLFNGFVITDGSAINMTKAVNSAGWSMPQWLTTVSGSNMVIFKPSQPLRQDNFITNESGSNFHEIAVADVYDAVQCIDDETRIQTLGMPAVLDAGYIWCTGLYTSESIARKQVGTLENGCPKYADTNNTTNDFELMPSPVIRRNGAKVPSWNTWAN